MKALVTARTSPRALELARQRAPSREVCHEGMSAFRGLRSQPVAGSRSTSDPLRSRRGLKLTRGFQCAPIDQRCLVRLPKDGIRPALATHPGNSRAYCRIVSGTFEPWRTVNRSSPGLLPVASTTASVSSNLTGRPDFLPRQLEVLLTRHFGNP